MNGKTQTIKMWLLGKSRYGEGRSIMANVAPKEMHELGKLAPVFEGARAAMGFIPNSMLTMAHVPQLPVAFSLLTNVVFGGDLKAQVERLTEVIPDQEDVEENLPPGLVQLIAFATSVSSGCSYCQAHTSHNVTRFGEDAAKLDNILVYDTSSVFSASEKAALALAFAAGAVPNESSPEHFSALREHFSERQIVQIVAVIAMFGFLNRWNDTMATQLEEQPAEFAARALGAVDWHLSKHG